MNPEILQAVERMTEAVRRRARSIAMMRYVKAGQYKTEGTYFRQAWRSIRELYNGEITEYEFLDDFNTYIDNQFTRAWRAGSKEMGVLESQWTDKDYAALATLIETEQGYMLQLADDILQARDEGKGYEQFRVRAQMWANRYNDVLNQARIHFGGKNYLIWLYTPGKSHCEDCDRLNGVVATADEWRAYHLRPQSRALMCGGYNCGCMLVPTSQPPTPGGIPK